MNQELEASESEKLLIRILMPRGDWFGIEKIAGFLLGLLPDLAQASNNRLCTPDLESLLRHLKAAESLGELVSIKEKRRGISGLLTQYPHHAGIYKLAENPGNVSDARKRIAALVIACSDEWAQRIERLGTHHPEYEAQQRTLKVRQYDAWLAIRNLDDEALELVDGTDLSAGSLDIRLADILANYDSRRMDGQTKDYVVKLARYFNYFVNHRKRKSKIGQGSERTDSPKLVAEEEPVPTDPESEVDEPSSKRIQSHPSTDERRDSELYKAGNSLEEIGFGPTFLQSDQPLRPARGDLPRNAILRSKGEQAHRRRKTQMLPGRWEELTDNEVYCWLEHVKQHTPEQIALAVAMLLCLLSGRDLEEVLGAGVVRSPEQLPIKPDPKRILIDVARRALVSGVLRPDERRQRESRWKTALQDSETTVVLPIPTVFWTWIEGHITPISNRSKKRSVDLFSKTETQEIRESIAEVVSQLRSGRKSRITLYRVEHQLLSELIRVGGDRVEASLITAREMPTGSSAALYYHACDQEKLASLYSQTTSRWADWFSSDSVQTSGNQPTLINGMVGSELVLTTRAVKKLIGDFRKQVEEARKGLASPDGLVLFHNAFMNYFLLILFFGTGYRAVRDPLSRETDVDLQEGLLVVADKTSDGMGHSRVIPLAPVLREQLEHLVTHLWWMRAQLKWTGHLDDETTSFLFYVAKNLEPSQVIPKTMTERFDWAYPKPLPLNLSRHWLRTELRAREVPAAFVDHFMGHWEAGREPWAKHACVDPWTFREVMAEAVDALLKDVGFVALKGAV